MLQRIVYNKAYLYSKVCQPHHKACLNTILRNHNGYQSQLLVCGQKSARFYSFDLRNCLYLCRRLNENHEQYRATCPPQVLSLHVQSRSIHCDIRRFEKESSKVEVTVKALKEEVQKKITEKDEKPKNGSITPDALGSPEPPKIASVATAPKRSLPKKIWDEILHYYHGFRLLFVDIKVSSRLVWKIMNGQDLSRREHKQLVRTVSDLFRLVPFSVFIIVPFMELLLPVAVKLFPNMLPSTFQSTSDRDVKFKKEFKMKLEMAKFLQDTLDEMALTSKGEKHSHNAKEFAEFFEKIRKSGEQASNEEIMKFSKLFEDEITLDSLTRPQLTALCRLLELQPIGTNNFLRFQLKMKLRNLKADDQMIQKEGVDSLTVPELQAACRARGMRALGVPEERLHSQLNQWLELSLNEQIPPSLLLLSRALYLPENLAATDQLKATLSSLPDAATMEAKYKIGEAEGKVDNKTKIELIKLEEEAIKKEQEETKLEELAIKEKERLAMEEKVDAAKVIDVGTEKIELKDAAPILKDAAVDLSEKATMEEIPVATAQKKPEEEQLSKADLEDIEDALDQIAKEKKRLMIEEEELSELKEEMADYKEDIEEFKEVALQTGDTKLKESKAATRLYSRVNKMITNMDKLMDELGKERSTLQEKIDNKAKEGIDVGNEKDNIININELVLAIRRIQKVSDDTRLQRIADVLDKMDEDHDGAVEVEDVLKVIELLGKENVKVSPQQMNEIIDLLAKEESLELQEKAAKLKEKESNKERALEKNSSS